MQTKTIDAAQAADRQVTGGMNGTLFHRLLRKAIPSGASLTFNPVAKAALGLADLPFRLFVRDFRHFPPAHLRLRVGVGDRIVDNHTQFMYCAHYWMAAMDRGWVTFKSDILDLGCGCGRYAMHLRDIDFIGDRYAGRYTGVDIDAEALDWCRKNFDDRFAWLHSTDGSTTYHGKGNGQAYRLPLEDASQDFVFSTSLFTHLLEGEARNYLAESARVLRPGGRIAHTVFCLDYPPPTYGTRHTFRHQLGATRVESLTNPEAAVAYTEATLFAMASRAGLTDVAVLSGPGVVQPILVGRKPA